MTRLQQARAAIDQARRERLGAHGDARFRPDREPHPRREYWRNYKRAQKQAAA